MTDFDSDVADYRERLAAAGLVRFADRLASLARRSVRLIPDPDASPAVGTCRLGGSPDLPTDTSWPRNDDLPLSFIAQINLAEVAPFEHEAALPREGLLSFFYEAVTQEAWGFDPADHGAAVVLFTPAKAEIHRRVAPDDLSPDGRSTRSH